jgi:signal-transduction protein with cAMP-binding, CBS, and nucleotidyltransferase domain
MRRFTVHGFESKGDAVASIGDKPMLYVVIGGGLLVHSADGRCLMEIGEGEAFGFSFCFGKEPLTVNIVAASRSQIVIIAPSVARRMKDVRRRAVSRCVRKIHRYIAR